MKVYDFLYYCFYSLVIKRGGDTSYERANALLTFVVIIFSMSTFIQLTILFDWTDFGSKVNYALILPIIAVIIMVLNTRYFIKSEKYLKISKEFKKHKTTSKVIAVILLITGFSLFVYSGISLSFFLRSKGL